MSEPSPPAPARPPSPKCIAILTCESIVRIANGGDLVIYRTFHAITARTLSCRHPHMTVLCTLTGGHGRYPIEVAVVNARAMMDVAVSRSVLDADNPLGLTDAVTEFHDVLLPEAGKYWVELRCKAPGDSSPGPGEILAQRPFQVHFRPPGQAQTKPRQQAPT